MEGRGGGHLESDLEFNKRLNTTSSLLSRFFFCVAAAAAGEKKKEKKKQEMGNKDGEGMKGGGGF